MPLLNTEAIILRRRRMRDADALLTLFGRACGRISASTKSVLKTTSRMAGITQPFNRIHTVLYAKQEDQDIWTLTQTSLIESYTNIQHDIRRMAWASYLVEWVEALSAEFESNAPVWELLVNAFERWNEREPTHEDLFYFTSRFLADAGLQPQIHHCMICGMETSSVWTYRPKDGGIICGSCGRESLSLCHGSIQILRKFVSSTQQPVIRCSDRQIKEITNLFQAHGEYHAGLQSRAAGFLAKMTEYGNERTAR